MIPRRILVGLVRTINSCITQEFTSLYITIFLMENFISNQSINQSMGGDPTLLMRQTSSIFVVHPNRSREKFEITPPALFIESVNRPLISLTSARIIFLTSGHLHLSLSLFFFSFTFFPPPFRVCVIHRLQLLVLIPFNNPP